MVVKTFMDMDQDSEDEKQQYLPLALHLASEFFLRNPNKDVRLLVACCLADIFRIYAPEAPYTSHDKLKNLAWVKSYNICFELEDCNEIFIQLFRTLFSVINNSHNQKVQMHMLDLMSSIIMEGDGVTQELLDSILINLIPAHKNLNKQAFDLAKVLLKRTVQTIEPCIANSNDGEERLAVVRLLAKLFGSKDSDLATQNRPLWQCFLGRFNDIHVPVRLESVKFASHCLMNHPDLAKDLTEYLKVRSHDPEEAIRHDVIVTIITAGKRDLSLVNDQLLGFVRERTLDKRWRVRKEAMMGLAQLYKKYCLHAEAGKDAAEKVSWIKDKLLHIYYQNSIDDKLLVEKIFAQYLVPHNLETEERMKCLYYLYASLDPNAVKALNEMWKCQNMLRSHSEANSAAMFGKLMTIAKNLPDPGKAQDFVKKFNQVLGDDEKLRSQLELLISPTCSCKQADVCVREIARKLANPKQPTNPFLEMVKFLLERIAPVHIDSEAISALVKLMNKSIEGTADDEEEGVSPDTAIRAGLELLKVLSFTHPTSFHSAETYESLLQCLRMEDDKVQAIKLLVRWLLGMKNNQSKSANSTLRLLSAMLVSEGDLTEQKRISKSDMSRLRLAAGSAIMKLAQEPCYHEIITPEQFQLCALVINDECYQVRQIFAQKLHKALVKLLLPLEYMAIFALCAKDPVKERRAHARQCLLKNISIRREYIKQNPMANEKLLSLLPEYVVPYMIHLLAHDPDFTKPQDVDQLRDVKECLWFMLEVLMTKNENNSHAFMKKMAENIKLTRDAQSPDEPKANEKLYTVCDVALCVINSKSALCNADSPKDPVLPTKFFTQPEKPKPTGVLGTVNKPLSATGRRPYIRTTGSETGSNISVNSELSSSAGNRSREQSSDISETGVSENDENPVRIISVTPAKTEPVKNKEINSDQATQGNSTERGKKRTATASGTENIHQKAEENNADETGPSLAAKTRRGRPPKPEPQGTTAKNEETNKPPVRGRKRAAASQESPGSIEAGNAKAPKQQDTAKKPAAAQRQIDLQRSQVLGSDGDSLLEIDSSPGYPQNALDLFKACESSQEENEDTEIAESGFLKV
ncbi:hypothetical protein ASZ78_005598 [Callipepla squamata]|uniref:PDS5 cohesin associated factor A n=1 Tax=Callipepla squamata TaxID=9009 RepID=A0A226NKI9_CALSU|nr:hypothetical protein ASZ78_005598 [Callipepla squamata]